LGLTQPAETNTATAVLEKDDEDEE
jgi:hypothetical protein